jgi:predicted dehydrogenase
VYELAEEIAGMAQAVRSRCPPRVTGEDGLWSVAMCLKAQESVETSVAVAF